MKSMDVIAGRYLVVKGPGEDRTLKGGFGAVYLCADQHDEGRPVALKTFQPQLLSDRAARDRFLREGDIWVRLGRHPSIVRAHGVIRVADGREMYVVTDWVAAAEGKRSASLREWLTPGRPVDTARALGWALQIVHAMKHATGLVPGFVHRDLKPENVLVGRDERARVTDFGLACMAVEADTAAVPTPETGSGSGSARGVRVTGGAGGTPPYMAPEQFDGGAVDLRADVYALGCLVVEMLAGEVPVRGATKDLPTYRALHRDGRALTAAESLPNDVRQWLRLCLAVRADERYATWNEVEAALRPVLERIAGPVSLAGKSADDDTREERVSTGWSLIAIGLSYLDLGKFQTAVQYLERARLVGTESSDRELEGAALGNLGLAFRYLGQVRRAIGYSEQHVAIARTRGDRAGEAKSLGNLGAALWSIGDARRAIGFYEQCLVIARELGDRTIESKTLGNMGSAYRDIGDARRAIGFFEQSLTIARELGHRADEAKSLSNLGTAYQNLGETTRAIVCFKASLAIAQAIGDRASEGVALGNLGSAFANLQDMQQAIGYFEQDLKIAGEIGDRAGAAITSFNLAMMFAQQDDVGKARTHAEVAARLFEEIGHTDRARAANQLLQQLSAPGA